MASEPLLDTSQFTTILDVQAIRVLSNKCQILMKLLKGKCLDRPRLKSVIPDPEDPKFRLILLKESVTCKYKVDHVLYRLTSQENLIKYSTCSTENSKLCSHHFISTLFVL
jgi:hypothetical protein